MSIAGKKIVLTGTFSEIDRTEAHTRLEGMGADVTGGVSSKTDMLFAGERAGSKLAKAQAAGIPVYGEAQLLKVLETGEAPAAKAAPKPQAAAPRSARSKPPGFPAYPEDGPYEEKNDAGVVTMSGQFADGKRIGTWTWFHENGEKKCEGAYIDGKQQGPEVNWYDTGEVECKGEYLDDERHGRWEWVFKTGEHKGTYTYDRGVKDGPYEWWHTPEQRHSVGAYQKDKHHGIWTWWRADGVVSTNRCYGDGGYKHGLEELYYENGQLKFRATWDNSQRVGLCESLYENGKPQERSNYVAGEYHGTVKTWDENGKKTTLEYVHGMPKDLDPKKLASAGKKIKKKKDSYDKMDCIDGIVDYGARAALLVRMHTEGHLNLSEEPMLWDELDALTITGAELASILSGIETYSPGKDYSISMLAPYWPQDLDELCVQVYARDPEPLDAAWESFPEPVRKGFALVLCRFGKLDPKDLDGDVLADLAKIHVKEYGLPHHLWTATDDGKAVEVALYGDAQIPNEHFYTFVESFGERQRWNKHLLKLAQKHGGNYNQLRDAFEGATLKQLEKLFEEVSPGIESTYHCLLELRSDGPGDLISLATSSEKDTLKEAAAISAILRLAPAGEPIPEELDDFIAFKGYQNSVSTPLFPGLAQTIAALQALPTERAHAIIERGLAHEYTPYYAIPVLGVIPDEALRKRAFEVIEKKAEEKYYNMQFMSHALAYWGKDALPVLQERFEAAKPAALRSTYRRAILIALADMAEAGESWDPAYDDHVEFHDWSKAIDGHQYEHYIQPFVKTAVKAMPIERARPLLIAAMDPEHKAPSRPLACLKDVQDTDVWRAAFSFLLDHADKIKGDAKYAVRNALPALQEGGEPWVRWCVENDPSPKLMAILKETYYDLNDKMKQWAEESGGDVKVPEALHKVDELVAQIKNFEGGGDRERIYLLKNVDEKPDDSLNQIGGCPPGVTAEDWPMYDDEPMEHMFTLDLDTMPEARGKGSKTRAVALFVHNPGNNEAYTPDNDRTEVVILTNEDVAKGPLEESPADGRDVGYFVPVAADVPSEVFNEDLPDDSELRELRGAIYQANARVLGGPIWLQDGEHFGFLVMQFDEGFVDINLGDMGVMYMFTDTAFWQCH